MKNVQIETIVVGPFQVNCYLVSPEKYLPGVIIDPGGDADLIIRRIEQLRFNPAAILLTHGHGDHIAAVEPLKTKFQLPLYVGAGDESMLASPSANISASFGFTITCPPAEHSVKDGYVFEIGELQFTILATPGHTVGGVCYLIGKHLFCGDTLFHGSIGRTDLPGGDYKQLLQSIEKNILTLPDDIFCYPGHGPITTIGYERKNNPFLRGQHFV